MSFKHTLLAGFFLVFSLFSFAQTASIQGTVTTEEGALEFVSIYLEDTSFGALTNQKGNFSIDDIPYGDYKVLTSYVGYKPIEQTITLSAEKQALDLDLSLTEKTMDLDAIVVTGTKTFKRQTNSPVIVNILNSETLDDVQACNLSEGLKFQPGLRVETDCQTCNYTQLRMNGLAGGYSQILVNGRPIFSPLTGLYGMEQLPVNLIDRIEVVRGGGSSLYGSSAIGGTVNVITKLPKKNSYELNYNYQNINGQTSDNQILGNATLVNKNDNAGVSFFLNRRDRGFYDHNADNYSEIPLIKNTSLGANLFFLPKENQKLELSVSNLNEYRFGGEMTDGPAHLAQQSEERTHHVWMANADYQINFNNDQSSIITYLAWQNTDREHYTGIIPDGGEDLENHFENPPYGTSDVSTYNIGLQINHRLKHSLLGTNVLTLGAEYVVDQVFDDIPAYNYLIDQTTQNLGAFLQSDWAITPKLTLLTGLRMDQHNLVDHLVWSPRASLLYKWKDNTQFRLNYGAGFRAPQAFDADLHIAFAGGGISRVLLSPELSSENSQSLSGSINYDLVSERYVAGFTLEGFYTKLNDAFFLEPIGEDEFGELFEKQNGQAATVQGITLELRANYDRKLQLETGFTLQQSQFENKVVYIEGIAGINEFIRTPKDYGFATLSFTPNPQLNANINYVYTGQMKLPHFAGAPNQLLDEMITTASFHELSAKVGYTINLPKLKSNMELYTGIKNIFNAYQDEFDIGKNRDSNFVYGPAQPRTFFVGLKLKQ